MALRRWAVPEAFKLGTLRPVVILPGVYESWHYLRPLAERLNSVGHPVHVIETLGLNRASIPSTATVVRDELEARQLHGVAIVAHSKGGIVGKHVMAFDDRDGRIDRMVAVASPFQGSTLARIAPNPALRAFLPHDPVITALAAERNVNARITSIYPRFDPHIPEGCRLDGAVNIEVPVVGHFRILLQPSVVEHVQHAVEQE